MKATIRDQHQRAGWFRAAGLIGMIASLGGCDGSLTDSSVTEVARAFTAPTVNVQFSADRLLFGKDLHQIALQLTNQEPSAVTYTAKATQSWATLGSSGGTIASGQTVTVYVTVDRCSQDWKPGIQTADVQVTLNGAAPVTIPLKIEMPAMRTDDQIAALLAPLPPLPKVHYSTDVSSRLVDTPDSAALYEWVRITHAVAISAAGARYERILAGVQACKKADAANPGFPSSMAATFSPYHYVLPTGVTASYSGPEVQQELNNMLARLQSFKTWLDQANSASGTSVKLSLVSLDTELWKPWKSDVPGADAWNGAIDAKYNAAYDVCKQVFPDARVDWFDRGHAIGYGGFFSGNEKGDLVSVELYSVHDLDALRTKWARGMQRASASGATFVMPWFNFNGGFDYGLPDGRERYVCDLTYPLVNSWQVGFETNSPAFVPPSGGSVPLSTASAGAFYPGPFDARFPEWVDHFVAYVKGANNIPLTP